MAENPGKRLRPSTVETIHDQLEFQMTQRPSWVGYHFPAIEERGRVEYGDIENLTEREADSVRHLLSSQILFGTKQIAKHKGRSISFAPKEEDEGDNGVSEWEIRNGQMREALADLCQVFGMPNPMP